MVTRDVVQAQRSGGKGELWALSLRCCADGRCCAGDGQGRSKRGWLVGPGCADVAGQGTGAVVGRIGAGTGRALAGGREREVEQDRRGHGRCRWASEPK